ncbi:FAD-dependent oxidoreductase [Microbacterium sp. P04]|uniref:FAD-dependent oxidoreductase n=1 Tax=Microbacterium sp. P04 TaxID=3366947 RepID=UPI0037463670
MSEPDFDETNAAAPTPAFEKLPPQLLSRFADYGVIENTTEGDILFQAGRDRQQLYVVQDGVVEMLRYEPGADSAAVVVRYGVGDVVGELALLTGQTSFVTARVAEAGRVRRLDAGEFRRLMNSETELSDELLRVFSARRDVLSTGAVAKTIEIIGDAHSGGSLALRTYAARHRIPHVWLEAGTPEAETRLEEAGLTGADLPLVYSAKGIFPRTTPGELAYVLGLTYPADARDVDLVVIGAGPGGMAAAVYGASEGLDTIVLDSTGVGGQAAASSRIENYLGFPSGISGAELLENSALQAEKFGAQIYAPCTVAGLDVSTGAVVLSLSDGTRMTPRATVIATGARYRALPLERWSEFEATSIYYAATDIEVREVAGEAVVVVGGANSAGQAALHLAASGNKVTVISRSPLRKSMSSYLADRLASHPSITIEEGAQVSKLHGGSTLSAVDVTNGEGTRMLACRGLFCFAGAQPETLWESVLQTDAKGFILTDNDLADYVSSPDGGVTWGALGRTPLAFETSIPTVFAVGDARRGSMKRVAAAVGEGASAVHSVHRALGGAS